MGFKRRRHRNNRIIGTTYFFFFHIISPCWIMRSIEDLINKSRKQSKIVVQKRFKSKKNHVGLITIDQQQYVVKIFSSQLQENMQIEIDVLKKASNTLNVPRIHEVDYENNVIIMSYIEGQNLCDVINDEHRSENEKQKIMRSLAKWFACFHQHFYDPENDWVRIRGDANMRNFILGEAIWGVDFEESKKGDPVRDIAELCASVLSTDPMFTEEKTVLCKEFATTYSRSVDWDLVDLDSHVSVVLREKRRWRPRQAAILERYATSIRNDSIW